MRTEARGESTRSKPETDVLICGAGPTGLVLALRLARAGVRVRIIDAAPERCTTSRALVVHARTLELYRQIGLADALLAEGLRFTSANLWVRRRPVAHVEVGAIGEGVSGFPYLLVCPQDRHERLLNEHLERAGVTVERPTELLDFDQAPDRVRARIRHADGREERVEAAFLAGCDGARSRVREVLGIGFPGGTYSHVFYVADVEATGAVMNDELHIAVDDADFLAIFPLRGQGTGRLIGIVRIEDEEARRMLTWDDVGRLSAERLGIHVERVNWFSTYRVHHRVAARFQAGRAFLLGDAGHIHSPVGAQGMNTGIGDAMNLGWKLAEVIHGRAPVALLDSYEPERRAFAVSLVRTIDRVFSFVTSTGRLARLVRTRIVPLVLPSLFRLGAMRRLWFRVLSQTALRYRKSRLSAGQAGAVRGGDRLPWVELEAGALSADNFAVLDGRGWQAHVYGAASPELSEECRTIGLPLHVFAWSPRMSEAGLTRDALYLMRPDGYVALVDGLARPAVLRSHVEELRLRLDGALGGDDRAADRAAAGMRERSR